HIFSFTAPPTPALYTLSLHDALPISLLDAAHGSGLLDRGDDNVAHGAVTTPGAADNLNAHQLPGAGVVGHLEAGVRLNQEGCSSADSSAASADSSAASGGSSSASGGSSAFS